MERQGIRMFLLSSTSVLVFLHEVLSTIRRRIFRMYCVYIKHLSVCHMYRDRGFIGCFSTSPCLCIYFMGTELF